MTRDRQSLVRNLLQSNETFKHLYEEHRELDRQVTEFDKKVYLTSEQQIEVSKLKKLKLRHKDRMEAIMSDHEYDNRSVSTGT